MQYDQNLTFFPPKITLKAFFDFIMDSHKRRHSSLSWITEVNDDPNSNVKKKRKEKKNTKEKPIIKS